MSVPADQANQDTADELREAVAGTGIDDASSPIVTTQGDSAIVVQTEPVTDDESAEIVDTIVDVTGVDPDGDISAERDRPELGTGGRRTIADRPGGVPGGPGALHLGLLP